MALTYATAVKTARITATRDQVANGTLEIGTTGFGSVLAIFGLDADAGSIAGDTWTLEFDANTVAAAATGVAAEARIKNSGGTVLITGITVGEGSGMVNLDNTDINSGQNVTLTSGTIQHAA